MKEALTLLKSPRDERDWHYGKIVCAGGELPEKVSLRQSCGPIRRQGKMRLLPQLCRDCAEKFAGDTGLGRAEIQLFPSGACQSGEGEGRHCLHRGQHAFRRLQGIMQ